MAFRQHYDQLSGAIFQFLTSKEAKEKQLGQTFVSLEYENLVTALTVAVKAQVSILNLYLVLSNYLDTTQDQRRGLELGDSLQTYPADKLAGPLGEEFVSVIDNIAKRQFLLKQYAQAEASYKRALSIWLENQSFDADQKRQRSASIYHQLGVVAQEQRQWHQAEDYFLRALPIFVEFNDDHNASIVLRRLARLWQDSGDASLPAAIAPILKITAEEAEKLLQDLLPEEK